MGSLVLLFKIVNFLQVVELDNRLTRVPKMILLEVKWECTEF